MGKDSDSETASENKLTFEQLSRKKIWGNPPEILLFQSTFIKVCLGERGERGFSFGPTVSPRKADAAELTVGRTKASSYWVEQTPTATEMATKTPLPSVTSESLR